MKNIFIAGAYDLYGTNANTVAGIIAATTGNPDLKWETTTQTNVGLDFGLINNSLSVSMDYYIKKTKDMLTIPPTLSVEGENAARWMNTGDMENKGFELTIDYRSPEYGDFSWGANVYVAPGFAVKLGLQPAFCINNKAKAKSGGSSVQTDGIDES